MKDMNFQALFPMPAKGGYINTLYGGTDSIGETVLLVPEVNKLCMAGGIPLQTKTDSHGSI